MRNAARAIPVPGHTAVALGFRYAKRSPRVAATQYAVVSPTSSSKRVNTRAPPCWHGSDKRQGGANVIAWRSWNPSESRPPHPADGVIEAHLAPMRVLLSLGFPRA